jgi:hypothetical protein
MNKTIPIQREYSRFSVPVFCNSCNITLMGHSYGQWVYFINRWVLFSLWALVQSDKEFVHYEKLHLESIQVCPCIKNDKSWLIEKLRVLLSGRSVCQECFLLFFFFCGDCSQPLDKLNLSFFSPLLQPQNRPSS